MIILELIFSRCQYVGRVRYGFSDQMDTQNAESAVTWHMLTNTSSHTYKLKKSLYFKIDSLKKYEFNNLQLNVKKKMNLRIGPRSGPRIVIQNQVSVSWGRISCWVQIFVLFSRNVPESELIREEFGPQTSNSWSRCLRIRFGKNTMKIDCSVVTNWIFHESLTCISWKHTLAIFATIKYR